jgi:3-oxoacyl-[acyl-carrier protein] reductase
MTNSLGGRVAVVTGAGRHRGIGTAICRTLAEKDADVFFTHWRNGENEPGILLEELRGAGVRVEAMELDHSLPGSPERLLNEVAERLGPPSILVNNAARSTGDGYEALDAATLDAHYAVNLRATALLSVVFARRFVGETGGRIVNLTSGQSLGPMPGELAYVATKGAIEAFTRTLAVEVGHKGITVNAVNPGPTDTGWISEDLKQEILPKFPPGRIGQPEDAARLVAFLASDEAAWITGQTIHSEGGFFRS